MDTIFKHRGRAFTPSDIDSLHRLIAENAGLSRRALSVRVCAAWGWRQANGAPRDLVCRGLMLQLHRAGGRTARAIGPSARRKKCRAIPCGKTSAACFAR